MTGTTLMALGLVLLVLAAAIFKDALENGRPGSSGKRCPKNCKRRA